MNIFSIIAGAFATIATILHFTVGLNKYLKSILKHEIDESLKIAFRLLFYYFSFFLVLSSFILSMIGIRGSGCFFDPLLVLGFIGGNYLIFGVVHFITVLTCNIKGALIKMYQWILWLVIALFTFLALKSAWVYVNEWAV